MVPELKTYCIPFAKMHGAGNDYIYVEAPAVNGINLPELAKAVSNRHTGVGSDGLVVISPSRTADFRMQMFNSDGSEAEMCGNASRCIARYVYEKGLTDKDIIMLETRAGIKVLRLHLTDGKVSKVTVDMGKPILSPAGIPVTPASDNSDTDPVIDREIKVLGHNLRLTAVGMGNPHGIIFCDSEPDDYLVLTLGPELEKHAIWPCKSNIEFVHVPDKDNVTVRVWERGTGETQACGTGACAVCVASVLNGHTSRRINVQLPGGLLETVWDTDTGHVYLTGPAEWICEGIYVYRNEAEEKLNLRS